MNPALTIENLRVLYTQNRQHSCVLENFSFSLQKGELVTLLGESGSGKTTCGKTLMGLLPPSAKVMSGTMQFGAEPKFSLSSGTNVWRKIRGKRIGMIYQDAQLALNPVKSIRSHFHETLGYHQLGSIDQIDAKSHEILTLMQFQDPARVLNAYPFELSGGMCQRVYIALILCLHPEILIADEPTSALDGISQKEVLSLLKAAQSQFDLSVLLITHDIGVAYQVSDRIVVLEKGSIVEEGIKKDVLMSPKHPYTAALIDARQFPVFSPAAAHKSKDVLLRVENVSKVFGEKGDTVKVLNKLNLNVYRDEIIGISGISGCGKSTLAKCIVGLEVPSTGKICYQGKDIVRLKGKNRRFVCQGIQMVFQDARASLNQRRTALQLVQEPLRYLQKQTAPDEFQQKAFYYLEQVGLEPEVQKRRPPQLSTGQCQRIAIARALILEPDILICDEAVSSLDMILQKQILDLLRTLQAKHRFSILMISHDIRVLRHFCQTIAVMKDGAFLEIIPTAMTGFKTAASDYTRLLLGGDTDIPEFVV